MRDVARLPHRRGQTTFVVGGEFLVRTTNRLRANDTTDAGGLTIKRIAPLTVNTPIRRMPFAFLPALRPRAGESKRNAALAARTNAHARPRRPVVIVSHQLTRLSQECVLGSPIGGIVFFLLMFRRLQGKGVQRSGKYLNSRA